MQFKIPQNLDIEDKIVGPLTMKGLVIAGVGGAICYWAYMNLDDETWPIIVFPVGLLTIAIIFVRINDMSFLKWIYSLFLLFTLPQKRVFKKLSDSPEIMFDTSILIEKKIKKDDKREELEKLKEEKRKKLEALQEHLKNSKF